GPGDTTAHMPGFNAGNSPLCGFQQGIPTFPGSLEQVRSVWHGTPSALGAQGGNYALPAGLQGSVDVAKRGLSDAAAAVYAHVGLQAPMRHRAVFLQVLVYQFDVRRVQAQLEYALLRTVHLKNFTHDIEYALGLGFQGLAQ